MIDSWPEAGAAVGAAGVIMAGVIKVLSFNKHSDEDAKRRGDEVLTILLRNQTDQTLILKELSMLFKNREENERDFHSGTQKSMNDIKDNQREILSAIRSYNFPKGPL